MRKVIYPIIAAAVAIAAMPAAAQAVQLKAGESELSNGSTVRWQSSSFKFHLENPTNDLTCSSSEFEGKATKNQGETAELTVASTALTGCAVAGHTAHVTSNASTEKPWTLQLQSAEESGQFKAHLDPASSSSIQFSAKIQEFGFAVATCDYAGSTVQFMGEESSDVLHIEGSGQLTLQSRSGIAAAECGTVGTTTATLQGETQLESGGNGVKAESFVEICESATMPCPEGESFEDDAIFTGALKTKTSLVLTLEDGAGGSITCSESAIELKFPDQSVKKPAMPATVTSLTFGKSCTNNKSEVCTVSATNLPWKIGLVPIGGGSGAMTVFTSGKGDPSLSTVCPGKTCNYSENVVFFKTAYTAGPPKETDLIANKIPFAGKTGGCPTGLQMSATWSLTPIMAIN